MSIALLRKLCCRSGQVLCITNNATKQLTVTPAASYSRRSGDSKRHESSYKVVKQRFTEDDGGEYLGCECGPNWELLTPRGNRFYFPNGVGPAWQGASTTMCLEEPLERLVDFDGTAASERKMLTFSVGECPSLIKKSLHELFPAPEVMSSQALALLTLKFDGDSEQGARKFVLAAREITARLRLNGYWADFMNPFSGKPFYSWASGRNLYKVDTRFRGLNMKLYKKNECLVISAESEDFSFSGAIYTNAPADYLQLKSIIDKQI